MSHSRTWWNSTLTLPAAAAILISAALGCRDKGASTGTTATRGSAPHAELPEARAASALSWAEVIENLPDPAVVVDEADRARMADTGLPWKVRDRATGIVLLLVPSGEYTRGRSPDDPEGDRDEGPPHRIRIPEPFYLGEVPVTVAQWRSFAATGYRTEAERRSGGRTVDTDASWRKLRDATWPNPFPLQPEAQPREDWPVVHVSWNDARAFCAHFGFRLPRESEWEYAARAGTTTRFWWGDDRESGHGKGNFADHAAIALFPNRPGFPFDDGHTFLAPVGSFEPNPWGFSDMLGNVWEWCETRYDSRFYAALSARPEPLYSQVDDEARGSRRVLRGGTWLFPPRGARVSFRGQGRPSDASDSRGLRVARTP